MLSRWLHISSIKALSAVSMITIEQQLTQALSSVSSISDYHRVPIYRCAALMTSNHDNMTGQQRMRRLSISSGAL